MVIDGGSCVNIIAKTTIDMLGLKAEPHPQPYNMTWVDKTTLLPSVVKCLSICLARVWCDVLGMDVAHILLGRSWLYDLDMISFGRSNCHEFKFNRKKVVLKRVKPQSAEGNKARTVTDNESKKSLHLVIKS